MPRVTALGSTGGTGDVSAAGDEEEVVRSLAQRVSRVGRALAEGFTTLSPCKPSESFPPPADALHRKLSGIARRVFGPEGSAGPSGSSRAKAVDADSLYLDLEASRNDLAACNAHADEAHGFLVAAPAVMDNALGMSYAEQHEGLRRYANLTSGFLKDGRRCLDKAGNRLSTVANGLAGVRSDKDRQSSLALLRERLAEANGAWLRWTWLNVADPTRVEGRYKHIQFLSAQRSRFSESERAALDKETTRCMGQAEGKRPALLRQVWADLATVKASLALAQVMGPQAVLSPACVRRALANVLQAFASVGVFMDVRIDMPQITSMPDMSQVCSALKQLGIETGEASVAAANRLMEELALGLIGSDPDAQAVGIATGLGEAIGEMVIAVSACMVGIDTSNDDEAKDNIAHRLCAYVEASDRMARVCGEVSDWLAGPIEGCTPPRVVPGWVELKAGLAGHQALFEALSWMGNLALDTSQDKGIRRPAEPVPSLDESHVALAVGEGMADRASTTLSDALDKPVVVSDEAFTGTFERAAAGIPNEQGMLNLLQSHLRGDLAQARACAQKARDLYRSHKAQRFELTSDAAFRSIVKELKSAGSLQRQALADLRKQTHRLGDEHRALFDELDADLLRGADQCKDMASWMKAFAKNPRSKPLTSANFQALLGFRTAAGERIVEFEWPQDPSAEGFLFMAAGLPTTEVVVREKSYRLWEGGGWSAGRRYVVHPHFRSYMAAQARSFDTVRPEDILTASAKYWVDRMDPGRWVDGPPDEAGKPTRIWEAVARADLTAVQAHGILQEVAHVPFPARGGR